MISTAVTSLHLDEPAAVVLSVPHGGTRVPPVFAQGLRLPPERLWSDWGTAELYDLTDQIAVPAVIARLSRFVADPNRPPAEPLHGDFWTTAVPARDRAGGPLYDRAVSDEELRARLDLAHAPYHRALERAVEAALRHHARVLLLDLHSFGVPLGVDVVLGDEKGRSARDAAIERLELALRHEGITVARNLRFTGGYVVRQWADDERVDAVQLELNQRCYLMASEVDATRPNPRRDPAKWARTRRSIATVIRSLIQG